MNCKALSPMKAGTWSICTLLMLSISLTDGALPAKADDELERPPSYEFRAVPGWTSPIPALKEWTENEKWAWQQISVALPVDFDRRYGKKVDAKNHTEWSEFEKERRSLSGDFLRTVLSRKPWRDAISEKGVVISGAFFRELVDISDIGPTPNIYIYNSYLRGGLYAVNANLGGCWRWMDAG